jgi:hypothetical protein
MRGIRIRKLTPAVVVSTNFGAYRLRIEITEVNGPDLDENLFLFQRVPSTPTDPEPRDYFVAVVSPTQLATAPIGEPVAEVDWPYFRDSSIELDCVSATQADLIYSTVISELSTLITVLGRLDTLQQDNEFWIGTPAP